MLLDCSLALSGKLSYLALLAVGSNVKSNAILEVAPYWDGMLVPANPLAPKQINCIPFNLF